MFIEFILYARHRADTAQVINMALALPTLKKVDTGQILL